MISTLTRNPYRHHHLTVHEHEIDGTASSCFGCKRRAWEEGYSAGWEDARSNMTVEDILRRDEATQKEER